MIRWLKLIKGKYRIRYGVCPACNSAADKRPSCQICYGYAKLPAPKSIQKLWWKSFVAKREMVVRQVILTLKNGFVIRGRINIHTDGKYYKFTKIRRTSDFLKYCAQFIIVMQVVDMDEPNKTIFINRDDISWVEEEDSRNIKDSK